MTNEELKKKIINLLDEATGSWYEDEDGMFAEGYSAEEGDNRFKAHVADALIAAGIGDVKEAEHRAERAERALDKAVKLFYEYRIESDVLSCSSCWIAEEAFKKCEAQGLYKGCPQRWKEEILIQAEKELAEEQKYD